MSNKINDILNSWTAGRNVLLYGPPATGKTRLISELFQALSEPTQNNQGILLDPNELESPFSRPTREISIPQPVKVVWTTFHQSFGYEDFVIGLRPEVSANGTRLQPWAGIFLDAALELIDPESTYKSVVIFIDEVNRGNAARIFGEFMTFLDFDYREDGRVPIPLPLRQLTYKNGISETIFRLGGKEVQIPENFLFPRHIYIVSTMNSVDRAAVPIDSALARRFDRIEMRPDLNVLAESWNLDISSIPPASHDANGLLSPFETAILLLDRLNLLIASDLGPEFELGHGLFTSLMPPSESPKTETKPVNDDEVWIKLALLWDDVIFPQLEERYSGRVEQLLSLLRIDSPPQSGSYAWKLRTSLGNNVSARTLDPVRVSGLEVNVIKTSFRWLVS